MNSFIKNNSILPNSILIALINTIITYVLLFALNSTDNNYKGCIIFLLVHPFLIFFSFLFGFLMASKWLNKNRYQYNSSKEKWVTYSLPIFIIALLFVVAFDYILFDLFDWKIIDYEKCLSAYLLSKNDNEQHIKNLPLVFQNIHFLKWCLPFLISLSYLFSIVKKIK